MMMMRMRKRRDDRPTDRQTNRQTEEKNQKSQAAALSRPDHALNIRHRTLLIDRADNKVLCRITKSAKLKKCIHVQR